MVFLSILNTLSTFTFHKLLTGTKRLKMFILCRSVNLMIVFGSAFLLSQHVRQYRPPSSLAALLGPDAEVFFRPPQRASADPGALSFFL
jgi:hypothetical protein